MLHARRNLDAWQMSMALAKTIYTLTTDLPAAEKYGLTSQMRRAAVSIPSNIAEGAARGSDAEFIRFLRVARGSLAELEDQLVFAAHVDFLANQDHPEDDGCH